MFKSRAIKYLKVSKLENEATMEAALRPKGVLLRYLELRREAARDEATLLALESDYRLLNLERAKISDPWQLITKPTILKYPVGPSRRNIALFGLIAGTLFGVLISFLKEKKSGKIFTLQQLEKIVPINYIEKINRNDQFKESKEISFFKDYLKTQKAKKIAFISLDKTNKFTCKN